MSINRTGALLVLALAAVCAPVVSAASLVKLTSIGVAVEGQVGRVCVPGGFVSPGDPVRVSIDAQRVSPGATVPGSVHLTDGAPRLTIAGGADSSVGFRYQEPSAPKSVLLYVQPDATVGPVRVQMKAVDSAGQSSDTAACTVNITARRFSVIGALAVVVASGDWELRSGARNDSRATLRNVPWRARVRRNIRINRTSERRRSQWVRMASGTIPEIAPGAIAHITVPIRQAGAEANLEYRVELDPANTLGEAESLRGDNLGMTTSTIPRAVQLLDPVRAAAAGATTALNQLDITPCPQIGVGDWQDLAWDGWAETPRSTGMLFIADCLLGSLLPFGTRADPEAYLGFTLKNGWLVSGFDEVEAVVDPSNPSFRSTGTFEWIIKPKVGTNDPHIKVHLVAAPRQIVKRGVRIFIEGPANKDPYRP